MPSFTTRMVLADGEWEDYEVLYEYMEQQGFSKTLTFNSGVTYKLPDAEYNYVGSVTRDEVLAKAKAAAERTGKKFSVLITESNGRTGFALERA